VDIASAWFERRRAPTPTNAAGQAALDTVQYGSLATLAQIGGAMGARSAREARGKSGKAGKPPTQEQVIANQAAQLAAYGKKRSGSTQPQKPY